MTEGDSYPYSAESRADDRTRYFYSAFHGLSFLAAWTEDRARFVQVAKAPAPKPDVNSSLPDLGTSVETAVLLEALLQDMMLNSGVTSRVRGWLKVLVKKFEVTGRIHAGYTEAFLAENKEDSRNFALYIRLAEVFETAYRLTGDLPLLNALLKCIDTLCACNAFLSDDLRARLSSLIDAERIHVVRVAEAQGVSV